MIWIWTLGTVERHHLVVWLPVMEVSEEELRSGSMEERRGIYDPEWEGLVIRFAIGW